MAFVADDPNLDEANKQQSGSTIGGDTTSGGGQGSLSIGGSNPAGTAPTLSGTTGGGSVGSGSATGNGSNNAPSSSGSFTNLNNYVTANQGNDATMGGAVTNTVKNAANSADTAGTNWQVATQSASDAATVKEDPALMSQLNGLVGGTTKASDIDSGNFNKQYNANYSGPTSSTIAGTSGYGDTQAAYNNVQTLGQEAGGGSADRSQLLQQTYGQNGQQYTPGEQNLDQFILGSGAAGSQALQNINNTYGNYGQNFSQLSQLVGAYGDANANTTAQTAADTRNAASQAYTGLQNRFDTLQGQVDQANKDLAAYNQGIMSGNAAALKAANYTPGQIAAYQANPSTLSGIVNQGSGQYSLGNLASMQDIANYNALTALINGAQPGTVAPKYSAAQFTPGQVTRAGYQQFAPSMDQTTLTAQQAPSFDTAPTLTAQQMQPSDVLTAAPTGGGWTNKGGPAYWGSNAGNDQNTYGNSNVKIDSGTGQAILNNVTGGQAPQLETLLGGGWR